MTTPMSHGLQGVDRCERNHQSGEQRQHVFSKYIVLMTDGEKHRQCTPGTKRSTLNPCDVHVRRAPQASHLHRRSWSRRTGKRCCNHAPARTTNYYAQTPVASLVAAFKDIGKKAADRLPASRIDDRGPGAFDDGAPKPSRNAGEK